MKTENVAVGSTDCLLGAFRRLYLIPACNTAFLNLILMRSKAQLKDIVTFKRKQ